MSKILSNESKAMAARAQETYTLGEIFKNKMIIKGDGTPYRTKASLIHLFLRQGIKPDTTGSQPTYRITAAQIKALNDFLRPIRVRAKDGSIITL